MNIKTQFSNRDCIVIDDNNRELLRLDFAKCKVFVSRFDDIPVGVRNDIADLYCELTQKDEHNKIMDFLNFKSDENEFCS